MHVTDEQIATELPCCGCGYLLHSLRVDQLCPECGYSVAKTVAEQQLSTWPLPWLLRLRRGLLLIQLAMPLGIVVIVIIMLRSWSNFDLVPRVDVLDNMRLHLPRWFSFSVEFVYVLLVLTGGVMVTFAGAGLAVAPDRPGLRKLARITLLGGTVVGISAVAIIYINNHSSYGIISNRLALFGWLMAVIVSQVAVWNLSTYLSRIARRIPDEKIASRILSFRWIAVLVITFWIAEYGFTWLSFFPIRNPRVGYSIVAIIESVMLVGRAGMICTALLAWSILARYRHQLDVLIRQRA